MKRLAPLVLAVFAACGDSSSQPGVEDAGGPDASVADAIADGSADAQRAADVVDAGVPLPAVPLHTEGRWIIDETAGRFKIAAVNWYGAEEQDFVVAGLDRARARDIAHTIRTLGFNTVRLPWSNEMLEKDPIVDDALVAANPELKGKHVMEVLDAVIGDLAHEGLLVILDNHASRADWCCNTADGNGLWYTDAYPESSWILDWQIIAVRYRDQPAVVGVDLRNEPRSVLAPGALLGCTSCDSDAGCTCKTAAWGGSDPSVDWHGAATRAGNAVLESNPRLLVFVEGINYATDLTGVATLPIQFHVPYKLVYEAHDYAWDHNGETTYAQIKTTLGDRWGYILAQNRPYTAPVWVGEFGTCHSSATCVSDTTGQGFWFDSFRRYLTEADIDWSYWAINGTEARGTGRTFGAEETYGVLDKTWTKSALPELSDALFALVKKTQGP